MDFTERTILLVDNDHDLQTKGVRVLRCDDAEKADLVCDKTAVDLVVADMKLKPFDGIELMKKLKSRFPQIVVILTAGFPNTSQVIKASQAGANDILGKEALTFELRNAVENALETVEALHKSETAPSQKSRNDDRTKIIGISKSFQDVFKIVGRVARTNAPVLVSGESGTGKELVAASIHEYSDRRKNEMVAINCGAIPENLLESELFGHEKGSFTGAAETLKSDVRIVAATNKNLADEVSAGNFREDLYYRLNVVELHLPNGMARIHLSGEAMAFLQQHTWPGNVRELENTMARACALASSDTLLPNDIPIGATIKRDHDESKLIDSLLALYDTHDDCTLTSVSKKLIHHVLDTNEGDLQATADRLGCSIKKLKTFIS